MPSRSVFAGVVTHPRSRFNVDGSASIRLEELARDLQAAGVAAETMVSDRNDRNPDEYPITRRTLLSSARYQARLEHRWRRYLVEAGAPGRRAGVDSVLAAAMAVKRMAAAVWGNPRADAETLTGGRAAVRLLNIDLSHLRVLEAGVASDCEWILVMEDDAAVREAAGAVDALVWLLDNLTPTRVDFVNLSESIDSEALGVRGLLRESDTMKPPADLGIRLLEARVPLTNTVCATLYRRAYAADLAACLRSRGLLPVAPIDWRVNACLMDFVAGGRLGSGSCVWVDPGMFLQRSMHDVPG